MSIKTGNTCPNTLPFWNYILWYDNERVESWNCASVIEASTAMQWLFKTCFCGNDDVPKSEAWLSNRSTTSQYKEAHQFSQGMHISSVVR